MPDQLVKISALPTVTSSGAQGANVLPIVNDSSTKAISFTELRNWLVSNGGAGAQGTAGTQGGIGAPGGGTAGAYFEKRYQKSNSVPSTPPNTPYPPSGWTITVPAGNQVLWSTIALINAAGTALETGNWSTPQREGRGQIAFYQDTEPAVAYILEGDTWYDTNDNNKIYRYEGTYGAGGSWVAAFTPFPNLDTSGNVQGLVRATGTDIRFAIIADRFQIIDPASPGTQGPANVPFEIADGNVYIKSAHIRNLDAGVIVGGEITAAISMQTPVIKAANVNNSSAVYNQDTTLSPTVPYAPVYTMPSICYTRNETSTPFNVTSGPDNPDGDVNWLSDACKFYGWNTGSTGFITNRFGKATMIFNYSFVGYADPTGAAANINLNVVYQINSGSVEQVQFPQADLVAGGLLLQQNGSVILSLGGTDTIRFGYRAAAASPTAINYSQLTITGFNI